MKKKLVGVLVLAGLAGMVLILPSLGVGQPPPGKGQKGGKGNLGGPGGGPRGPGGGPGGGMNFDPSKIFDFMSKGNDFILINDMRQGRDDALQWAQNNGITNGQLTREQFTAYMNAKMKGGMAGGPGGNPSMTPEEMDRQAELRFKLADRNGDGVLNEDEMSGRLKQIWQQYDKNKDGVIDLEEYKAYFRDMQAERDARQKQMEQDAGKVQNTGEEDWEKRPTVYRAGHLPRELPWWFAAYDTDQDGQVGLYEWRAAGQPYDRFQEMDRNGDGLLTAEEVLYFMKLHPEVYGPVRTADTSVTMNNNSWQAWQPPQQQQWPGKGMMQFNKGFGPQQMGMNPWQNNGMNRQWPNQDPNNQRQMRMYDPNSQGPGGPGRKSGPGGPGGTGGPGGKKGKGGYGQGGGGDE
jgi:Ca2+-binding EF-hand superfamily protein